MLEDAWSKLSMTEEESQVVVFKGDTPVKKYEEITLSLL